MKFPSLLRSLKFIIAIILFVYTYASQAQTLGLIYKPATNGGNKILDPNGDGYVSKTTSGFPGANMDEGAAYSEIPYQPFPVFMNEPLSDLSTGSKGGHTDYAPKVFDASGKPIGSPLATYFDGTNFLFRVRLGGQSTASKGYSILIDINNDVSGTGINPGFEFEVVLATNFDVRIYDHRTNTTGGTIIFNGSVDQYSQKAIAASLGGGDADYFYDFYVPMAAFNGGITASTTLRMTGVTVTSAKSGIFGIASDLGGVDDQKYSGNITGAWKDAINNAPATSPTGIQTGGFAAVYAKAPVVTAPILTTSTSVTGYSVEAAGSVISVYQGSTLLGTTTVTSTGTWTLSTFSTPLVANGVITATVKPADKSLSPKSAEVIVKTVQSMCKTSPPIITGSDGSKGFFITTYESGTLRIFKLTAPNTWTLDKVFANTTPGTSVSYAYGTAAKSLPDGTYYATLLPSGGCESERSNEICFIADNGNNGTSTTLVAPPTITTTSLNLSSTLLQGSSAVAGAKVTIYQNGIVVGTIQLATGATSWSYTLSGLSANDIFYAKITQGTSPCGVELSSGRSTTLTVVDTSVPAASTAPTITGNYCGPTTTVTGTSSEAPGTTIKVYNGTTVLATTTVNAFGAWTATAATSIASGTSITAKATAYGKTESAASTAIVIGTVYSATGLTITNTSPIYEGSTSVSGTAPANAWVTLYINGAPYVDGEGKAIVKQANTSGAWTITGISPFELYAGAKLTITAKASATSTCESAQSTGIVEVACIPASTSMSAALAASTICPDTPATINLSTSEAGVIYNIYRRTSPTTYETFGSSILGTGKPISLKSNNITTTGTVLLVKTIKVGASCQYTIGGELTVNLYPPVPKNFTVTAVPESSTCANVSTIITVKAAETGYSYQLINNDTKASIGSAIIPTAADNGKDLVFPAVTVTKTTTYGVVIKGVTSGCVAENTILKTITISGGPDVTVPVTVDKTTICVNTSVNLSVSTQGSAYTYKIYNESDPATALFTFSGTGGVVSRTITTPFTTTGTKNLYVTVTGGGCSDLVLANKASITVTNGIATPVSAGTEQITCGNASLQLQGSNPAPGSGLWTLKTKPTGAPDPVITNPTFANATVTGLVSGTYEFTWTVSACAGASSSSTVTIIINCTAELSVSTTKFVQDYINGDILAVISDDKDGGITSFLATATSLPPGTAFSIINKQVVLKVTDISLLKAGSYSFTTRTTDSKTRTSDTPMLIRMYDSNTAPSSFTPLPVELAYFTGTYNGSTVMLKWLTASEKNNEKFIIERSSNGKTFEVIGQVAGQGDSFQATRYSFTDQQPGGHHLYYRLKQVDFDGTSTYSKIIALSGTTATQSQLALTAYPNPTKGLCTALVTNQEAGTSHIQLLDLQGRLVLQKTLYLEKGLAEIPLDLSNTATGLYLLQVQTGNHTQQTKVLISR
ncbi:T9SS type A sorting domain-containing protein [Pontibacter vulgaris]|uniref:T9SS type A sorting domain-containing protein n=1 Tax=Pontibacter vulgaris TaxID=2905679 RepID=UPI001FA7B1DD|nr:T9SS type A sorting domain-containing protein [Pontibacter vulgaris]